MTISFHELPDPNAAVSGSACDHSQAAMDKYWAATFKCCRGFVVAVLLLVCSARVPAALALAQSVSVSEFLNIDCGATKTHVDPITNFTWVPDTAYIDSAAGKTFVHEYPMLDFPETASLRYFDDLRPKNCYTLPVTAGSTYLLRVTYFYFNYDAAAEQPPWFEMAIDATVVQHLNNTADEMLFGEYQYVAQSNVTYLCLIRTSPLSKPFISSISLKPATVLSGGHNVKFRDFLEQGNIMTTIARVNYGGTTLIRAPDDFYDRFWFPEGPNITSYLKPKASPYEFLATAAPIPIVAARTYPPTAVLQTAVASNDTIETFLLPRKWNPSSKQATWYVSTYFAELINASGTPTPRNFIIEALGNVASASTDGAFLQSYIADLWPSNVKAGQNSTLTMSAVVDSSSAGPILNCMEVFAILGSQAPKTVDRDALAIEDIKRDLNLKEWTGDPCLPVPHSWISCSTPDDTTQQPHIIAVNLSGYQLEGRIPASFANLLELTTLRLENNSLNGPLPEWLTNLAYLSILYVQNNNFEGPIPQALLLANSHILFTEFILKVAALEIYNEVVKDLLTSEGAPLRLLDDKEKGIIVDKLKEDVVRDVNHLREVIKICEAQRQVGETSLNDTSSRSHQIIRLTVESHPCGVAAGTPATSLVASLNFVDLAGSERASQTQADGARLKEGAHINRSLLTLSTCIRKLSGGSKKGGHIPYRDSKLTRILQHSLGGNARTAIICTMSPAHSHVEQSRNTLAFATRAKEVVNTTHINMVVSDKVLVKQLQKEVARLEAELKVPDSATETATSEALLQAKDLQIQKMEEELKELQTQRDAAQARLDEVSRKLEAEGVAKKLAEESAKKLAEVAIIRPPLTPGPQSISHTPLSITANRRRWSDSGDYLIRKLEGQCQPHTPPSTLRPKGPSMSIRQSSAASVMLVQEIRKLENLQDELGDDANRALEALQKEVECLRLAQAGMNHDAASTVKKLQDEIHTMHSLRSTASRTKGFENKEDVATIRQSISLNHVTLRQELSRLGDKDKTDADAAIATLEEQLESVQRSLDKMILANETQSPQEPGESPRTPARKKHIPLSPAAGIARQRLTAETPCSPAARRSLRYLNNENNENTPPRAPRDNGGDHATPRGNGHHKQGASPAKSDISSQSKESPGGGHKRSNSVDIRKMQNLFKTAAEDNIKSIRSYVTELKERVAKLQYQKQLLVCQVLELEANGNEEEEEGGDDLNEDELAMEPVQSPGSWKSQFDQQRALIFELWDSCNVSIIHRTQFYLLFKGDPADGIYMEVELRRLTWLQENFNAEAVSNEHHVNAIDEHLIPPSPNCSNSTKSLKRERELLARQMSRRLSTEEREDLFMRWGVPLDGKQRKLQLISKLWMDSHNLGHIQASAEIVARIVGIINPGSAPKEMFALNFAPPNHAERPHMFGWNGLSALLNF